MNPKLIVSGNYYSDYSSDYNTIYDTNIIFYDDETATWNDETSDDPNIPPTKIIAEDFMLECPGQDSEAEC